MGWRWPDWTGIGEKKWPKEEGEVRRAKTLWDWLQLLIVPVILIGAVALWNSSQTSRDKRREDQARQDAMLTAYLTQMSDLILYGKLLKAEEGSAVKAVARSATLAVVRRLDGERKAGVLRFLYEGHLLHVPRKHAVYLNGADLSRARLEDAQLQGAFLGDKVLENADVGLVNAGGANLSGANLRHANLTGVTLGGADLNHANLRDANLRGAKLGGADLRHADLRNADLTRDRNGVSANLGGADLRHANLSNADLSWAYLSSAKLEDANLSGADLEGATMVDATGLDLDRYISALPLAERKVFLHSQEDFLNSLLRDKKLRDKKLAAFKLTPKRLAKLREDASGT